jgi:hypothetical protein
MLMLLEASLEILLLFLPLVGVLQDLVGVLGMIRYSTDIFDLDIDDAVSYAGPQATDKNIPSVFASVLVKVARNWEI